MKMIHLLCCSLLLVTATFAQRPSKEAHALIGTWRVVEFADLDKDGKWQYWFGDIHGDTSFTTQPGTCTFRS
jgi:hypothetical protein